MLGYLPCLASFLRFLNVSDKREPIWSYFLRR